MDEVLIVNVAEALKFNVPTSNIHDVLKEKGFSEEEIFLAIKAGQIFLDHSKILDKEVENRKLPFVRRK